MAGRTLTRFARCYVDGYDLSGFSRSIGPLVWEYAFADLTAKMGDAVVGGLPDTPTISAGTLNGVFDNTATVGMQAALSTAGQARTILVPIGDRAAPAEGDPAFMGIFEQTGYFAQENGGAMTVSVPFGMWDVANMITHEKPWGWLLHELSAETAVNSATGIDDNGASSANGGYMVWQVTGGDGTVTITTQHASTNSDPSFANLTGATSGSIDASAAPLSGLAEVALGTTVNRYLRWQISLGTATTVTFALGFVRANA